MLQYLLYLFYLFWTTTTKIIITSMLIVSMLGCRCLLLIICKYSDDEYYDLSRVVHIITYRTYYTTLHSMYTSSLVLFWYLSRLLLNTVIIM